MRIILPFVCLGFVFLTATCAAQRPAVEILEYGIYAGTRGQSVADKDALTGQVLLGGAVKLQKQTAVIPAKLKNKFGFRFVVHGQPEDGPVRLHFVYLFPEMKDPASGRKLER